LFGTLYIVDANFKHLYCIYSSDNRPSSLEPVDVAKKLKIIKSQAEFVVEAWEYVNVVNNVARKSTQQQSEGKGKKCK